MLNRTPDHSSLGLNELERRLQHIDTQLEELPHYSLRTGVGSIGYRSLPAPTKETTEWFEVTFEKETPIDQIVLVPTIWRNIAEGYVDDGFPEAFSVIIGNQQHPDGVVIASYSAEDGLLPRIAPLVIFCEGQNARWVRIQTTVLTPRAIDGRYDFQLAEILVFHGQQNVALRQPVTTSSPSHVFSNAWHESYLVDGAMPYLMNTVTSQGSLALINTPKASNELFVTIDLGTAVPLTGIQLHAVDQSDSVPQSNFGDYGVPRRLQIEGALQEDFSDTKVLTEFTWETLYDLSPIIMLRVPETLCRYVRVTGFDQFSPRHDDPARKRFGFTEIELLSHGINVAQHKSVTANFNVESSERPLCALTDGRNLYGGIISIRDWVNQLALRHELERERPMVLAELSERYASQKTWLNRMYWISALLAAGIGFTILIDRMRQIQVVTEIKERFAADLHDELGANIHTIGLLSDTAQHAGNTQAELKALHRRIRTLTERTGSSIRNFVGILENDSPYQNFEKEMRRASERVVTNFEHDIMVQGQPHLRQLKPRTRADLFLFYKEALVNVCRHASATRCETRLIATERNLTLTMRDDGVGLSFSKQAPAPPSLIRRARLMGGKVDAENLIDGGTRITLSLKTHRWFRNK